MPPTLFLIGPDGPLMFMPESVADNSRAVSSFCDGHAESWKWPDTRANNNDVFAVSSS